MHQRTLFFIAFLLISLKTAAQSSLYIGAGPSVNHITMDIAPASIPNFDVLHRLSVNAEVLYGYQFSNRWQLLAGAGMSSIKYGVEAGNWIKPNDASLLNKYFIRKNWVDMSTLTPVFLSVGGGYTFIQQPRFEVDASLMLDAVYLKRLRLIPLENYAYGTGYVFDQFAYRTGFNFFLQPGIRLKRITRHNFSYWLKAKASLGSGSVLEARSSVLTHGNQDYEATIRTNGSSFSLMAGIELPLSGKVKDKKPSVPAVSSPNRQLLTARVGLSVSAPSLIEDSGNQLQANRHIGGYVGVLLEERISGPFYIGSGLTLFTLSEYYNFSLPSGNQSGGVSGKTLFGIPVSLAWYRMDKKWSARLAGGLGYILPFITKTSQGGSRYMESTAVLENGDTFKYKVDTQVPHSSTLYLDLDVSASYKLSKRFALHSFAGYSYGFRPFLQSQISYQYNDGQLQAAKMSFGLNHLNFGLGVRYVLNRF